MNRNNKTSNITESAMIAAILVIIAFLSSFISIVMFFYPTPAIILAKRRGIKYAALSLLAADIIISILMGITDGLMFFIVYTPFALALAYGIYRDENADKTILYGSAAYMVSFVVLILLMNLLMGVNFVEQLKDIYSESYDAAEEMLSNAPAAVEPGETDEALKALGDYRKMTDFLISNLFPAMIIFASVLASYINYLVAVRFSKRFSIIIKKHEGLSRFSFPRTFIVAMAVLLLISYLLKALKFNVEVIQLNLFYIIFIAMVLQGAAVIKFVLEKRKVNKPIQILIIFMIFYMSLLLAGIIQIIAAVGLIDLAMNLRKINGAA